MPGDSITRVAGVGTCSRCGSEFPQADIYGGQYDETAVAVSTSEQYSRISVVVFRIGSNSPPSNVESYCKRVLNDKYPHAQLDNYYVVGFQDNLTNDEAVALYQNFVSKGQLPNLGKQVNSLKTSILGDSVVALYFA